MANEIKVGDKVHVGMRKKGGAGISGTVVKLDGDRVHIKNQEGKEYRGSIEYTMKEEVSPAEIGEAYGESDHIEQTLADMDINSKVDGKTVTVNKENVSKAKRVIKKLGHDHEVKSGLNEEEVSVSSEPIKLSSEQVVSIVVDESVHFMDVSTGQLFKSISEEEYDEEVILDILDEMTEEELEAVIQEDEGLVEVVIDKRDFVVHFTDAGSGKKTRRKETAFSPAGLARKYEMNDHKVHDITHNGKSVMDEVRNVNSRRMNEEEINELSSDTLYKYASAAHKDLKAIKDKHSYASFLTGTRTKHNSDEPEHVRRQVNRNAGLQRAGAAIDKARRKERGLAPRKAPETKQRITPGASSTKGYSMSGGDGLGKNHGYGQGRYMGDSVEIEGVEAICEAVVLEGGVYFHANPVIKDKGHLLAIQNILSSSGAAGRKSFSGTELAKVTKKIHDKAGIGNDVWDHIHTSRATNESFSFIKTFSEFVLESSVEQLDELSKYTLTRYIIKASGDQASNTISAAYSDDKTRKGFIEKGKKRANSIGRAAVKLSKKAPIEM